MRPRIRVHAASRDSGYRIRSIVSGVTAAIIDEYSSGQTKRLAFDSLRVRVVRQFLELSDVIVLVLAARDVVERAIAPDQPGGTD